VVPPTNELRALIGNPRYGEGDIKEFLNSVVGGTERDKEFVRYSKYELGRQTWIHCFSESNV
jgi:hypothetical protein